MYRKKKLKHKSRQKKINDRLINAVKVLKFKFTLT